MTGGATLRLFDKAGRDIEALDPRTLEEVYRFQRDFRRNPHEGLFPREQLPGDGRLWAVALSRESDHRAVMLRIAQHDWLLISVRHQDEVRQYADRLAYGINQITGAIEYVDLREADAVEAARPGADTPLFAELGEKKLAELGVAEPLIPIVLKLTTDDEVRALADVAPGHTREVLLRLRDGLSYDKVREQVTKPVEVEPEKLDTEDWQSAVGRTRAVVVTDDESLQSIIEEGKFGRWKVFLHPTQQKLVARKYSGAVRVSGGPGTGKTVVALHRVKHLVDRLRPGHTKPVLLTTFNRNLAADLRARLLSLGGPETVARVDIVHVDQLATRLVRESDPGNTKRRIEDAQALKEWRALLMEAGEHRWSAEFLSDEWNQVILGQAVHSRADYFQVRRAGRGRTLNRAERAQVWQLTERFTQRLELKGLETHRQVAERAARLEMDRKEKIDKRQRETDERGGLANVHVESGSGAFLRYRYRHIVVDEAQDLSAAHWKMLRAMVPVGPDDLFLAGDTHQRIYDNQVTLGSLGINIRGRSSRLTLSYRTTREILRDATRVLEGAQYDDLDGDKDSLEGYRSVLHGGRPVLRGTASWDEELDAITEQLRAWHGIPRESVAVCVPTNEMASDVEHRLARHGITSTVITRDGLPRNEGVHIGTMYRFKGLEYQGMIIAGVSEGLVPRSSVDAWERTDRLRHQRELQRARSLLFVAATRARDTLAIFWHGEPSRFLGPLTGENGAHLDRPATG
ncbi:UvrD-helicase domain-containing protein [Streptomyces sp. NPDC047081]|uniref:UvrD-helicase domain-containing protein n=1 Tax=Streptomyces sp. NPDC047081 TaxID=3154706 RepID=UPI0033F2ECC6